VHLDNINLPPYSPGHIFGTDYLGRDVFAEAIWGSRASLVVGLFAALIAVSFGSIWGSLSAFAGGIVDAIMMRTVDGLLSIPSIILLLALNALLSAPSIVATLPPPVLSLLHITSYSFGNLPIVTVVAVISATTWLEAARISRAKITSVKSEEYIEAASALGMSTSRMLFRHLLPNAASVLMVEATLLVSDAVLMESGLSFLGLGLGPANPSWGSMLTAAQISLTQGNWWAVFVPGLLITLTVGSVNLIGEGWLEMLGRRHPAA
jgi:peptide/nickel transport system permease protein